MTNTPFGPKGWTPERLGSLVGKTFVITGATTGTGYEATRVFLSKGARVVMLNRNGTASAAVIAQMKQEFGQDADISFIHMDLSVLWSVRNAAEEVLRTVPQIDALICNAAISTVAKQELTIDGFESHLGVNHYGHFVLCGLLFDRIDVSRGRIVVMSSLGYNLGLRRIQFEDMNFDKNYSPMAPYAHSKLAQMMFGFELQRRVTEAGRNVEVHVCHPGAARTKLIEGDNLNRLGQIIWPLVNPFIAQSAEKGSWPLVLCATEQGLKPETFYGPTQMGGLFGAINECPLKPHALDRDVSVRLWDVSQDMTGYEWSPKPATQDRSNG